jgi:hypothetical protein
MDLKPPTVCILRNIYIPIWYVHLVCMFKLTFNKKVACFVCVFHLLIGRRKSIVFNSFINFPRHLFIKHSLRYASLVPNIKRVSKVPFINLVA